MCDFFLGAKCKNVRTLDILFDCVWLSFFSPFVRKKDIMRSRNAQKVFLTGCLDFVECHLGSLIWIACKIILVCANCKSNGSHVIVLVCANCKSNGSHVIVIVHFVKRFCFFVFGYGLLGC
jgi:hypothetical protein